MAQNPNAGVLAYGNYGFEANWGTVAASFPRPFGTGIKITNNEKNNFERIFGIGARNASNAVAMKYEGSLSIEFMLGAGNTAISDGGSSWLRAVMGAVPTDAGSGPYTHSYAESNTLASFSVAAGEELGTNDYVANYIGCTVASCDMSASIGEVISVKLECPYKTVTVATSGISSQDAPNETPLTFVQGAISVAGSTVAIVQSFDLTINHNLEMLWGFGSRYAAAAVPKKREYTFKLNVAFNDPSALLPSFYGKSLSIASGDLATLNPAGVALVLTFDNGLSSTSSRKVVCTFANFFLDTHTLNLDVNEVVKEDISGFALSCTSIVVTNNTTTDVATP